MQYLGRFTSVRQAGLLAAAIVLKMILMTIAPLSLDLAFIMSQLSFPSTHALTPYGAFIESILAFWRIIPIDHPSISSEWTVDFFHASAGLYLLVFLVKLPLLILDFLTGILLYTIVLKEGFGEKKASFAFFLWFLNPYVFLMNEMWGTFDILPTFLVLLAFAFLRVKDRRAWGAVSYAAATALKLFPIMFLPIFPSVGRRSKFSLLFVASGLLGGALYFGWLLYAGYNPWLQLKQYDVFTQYFDEYLIATSDGVKLGLATIALVITFVLMAERWPRDNEAARDGALLVFLIFFAFGSWFPQSLIWLVPFLVLDVAVGQRKPAYMAVLLSSALFFDVIAFYSYFTSNGNAFFFIPATNPMLTEAVAIYEAIAREEFVVLLGGPLARALFTSTCMVYSIKLIEKRTGIISTFLRLVSDKEFGRL